MTYTVTLAYEYKVEAESNQEAELKAMRMYKKDVPSTEDMTITTSWTKKFK